MKKILFSLLLAFVFLILMPARAAEPLPPQKNPQCWSKKECVDARRNILSTVISSPDNSTLERGWVGEAPCNVPGWGKCLPGALTETEIAFGGQTRFTNIGEFIKIIYNYVLRIVSIVAVVMIIIAGIQWVTSAGNSEAITSAKKRIGGSLMGLFLAYLSYSILNTLNPALVNLRVPQVWLLRDVPLVQVGPFCRDMSAADRFALAPSGGTSPNEQMAEHKLPSTPLDYSLQNIPNNDSNQRQFYCGKNFFVRGGGDNTCRGDYCPTGQMCMNLGDKQPADPRHYYCDRAMLAGIIVGPSSPKPLVDKDIKLIAYCANGDIKEAARANVDTSKDPIIFKFAPNNSSIDRVCGNAGVRGFYLGVLVNNDNTNYNNWFAVAQASRGSHECSINISKLAWQAVLPSSNQYYNDPDVQTCSGLSAPNLRNRIKDNDNFLSHLISLDELKRGYLCNLIIGRPEFTPIDKGNRKSKTAWYNIFYGGIVRRAFEEVVDTARLLNDQTDCFDSA